MNIGRKIRVLRELKNYTQEYMADVMEISQRTYSKLENDQIKIDLKKLIEISKILDIEAVNLLSDIEEFRIDGNGDIINFYVSSKEYIQHLLEENKYLKELNEKLMKLLEKK